MMTGEHVTGQKMKRQHDDRRVCDRAKGDETG